MSAWQFAVNQDDSRGKAASALEAFGLTTTNTRGLDLFICELKPQDRGAVVEQR